MQHLKTGGKKVFKNLFDTYFNALCSFAYKYIPDINTVQDLVQESFIALWHKHQEIDNENIAKAFLYTTVRNKCLNYLKHESVVQKHESSLILELESEQFFQNHIIEEEVFNQLHNEIKKLPEAAKEIMFLALNGLKNQEIADELSISVNTVKTQKKIAYAKLKNKISPVLGGVLLSL